MNTTVASGLKPLSPRSFWRWQVLGWLAYGIAMFVAAVQELPVGQALINKCVNVGIGLTLSLGLRALFLGLRGRAHSLSVIIPAMLLACLAAGAAWSALANGFFWFYLFGDFASMGVGNLFAWTLVHAIVFVAWCALYMGAQLVADSRQASREAQTARFEPADDNTPAPLVIRTDGELLRLPQDQIHCIEAARNYSCIVSDAGTHVVRLPLSTLGARLDSKAFIRVHRSAIVSVNKLLSVRALPTQDAIATLAGGREIRVSRSFRAQLEQALAMRH